MFRVFEFLSVLTNSGVSFAHIIVTVMGPISEYFTASQNATGELHVFLHNFVPVGNVQNYGAVG